MKLITAEITKALEAAPLSSQDDKPKTEINVIVKFFNPSGAGTWYVTEGQRQGDDWLFYGLVILQDAELGYFTLSELANLKCPPFGMPIERDIHWSGTLAEVCPEHV